MSLPYKEISYPLMNGEEFCPHEWSKPNTGEGFFPFINRAAPELPMETGKLSCMVLRKMHFLASGETTSKLILFSFHLMLTYSKASSLMDNPAATVTNTFVCMDTSWTSRAVLVECWAVRMPLSRNLRVPDSFNLTVGPGKFFLLISEADFFSSPYLNLLTTAWYWTFPNLPQRSSPCINTH